MILFRGVAEPMPYAECRAWTSHPVARANLHWEGLGRADAAVCLRQMFRGPGCRRHAEGTEASMHMACVH